MTPEMAAAFLSGAGWNAAYVATAVSLIVGAVAMLWCANTVRALGQLALDSAMKHPVVLRYVVRALILVMLLIYLLS